MIKFICLVASPQEEIIYERKKILSRDILIICFVFWDYDFLLLLSLSHQLIVYPINIFSLCKKIMTNKNNSFP